MSIASEPQGLSPESALNDAVAAWEGACSAAADQLRPTLEAVADAAAASLEAARDAVAEAARRRPVASVLAALSAGVLIGCLIAGRRR